MHAVYRAVLWAHLPAPALPCLSVGQCCELICLHPPCPAALRCCPSTHPKRAATITTMAVASSMQKPRLFEIMTDLTP